jgi:hypothetical protein
LHQRPLNVGAAKEFLHGVDVLAGFQQRSLSVRGKLHAANGERMKNGNSKKVDADRVSADEILPEYDFSRARPNKYAARYPKGGIVVTLDPDAVIGAENACHAR